MEVLAACSSQSRMTQAAVSGITLIRPTYILQSSLESTLGKLNKISADTRIKVPQLNNKRTQMAPNSPTR